MIWALFLVTPKFEINVDLQNFIRMQGVKSRKMGKEKNRIGGIEFARKNHKKVEKIFCFDNCSWHVRGKIFPRLI